MYQARTKPCFLLVLSSENIYLLSLSVCFCPCLVSLLLFFKNYIDSVIQANAVVFLLSVKISKTLWQGYIFSWIRNNPPIWPYKLIADTQYRTKYVLVRRPSPDGRTHGHGHAHDADADADADGRRESPPAGPTTEPTAATATAAAEFHATAPENEGETFWIMIYLQSTFHIHLY